ncbi:MAG: S41 family peptidase, partial [Muribaculaceae bacterium]|nr:S41 family peptidase [Muribaculaceae bacterium]
GRYRLAETVLENLISQNIEINNDIYCTENYFNENKNPKFHRDVTRRLYVKNDKRTLKGWADGGKNLYLLISDYTGSSADWFAYEFKKNKLGTVAGTNNTSGERCGAVTFDCLEKSGIFFYYTPYETYDGNGVSNSVYGTSPDIYLSSGIENYFVRRQIMEEGQDPYAYENRMKWDSVLAEIVGKVNEPN